MKIKSLFSMIAKGLYYLGKGCSTLSLYPQIDYTLTKNDKEAFKKDAENLMGDWRRVGKDLEKAILEYRK